jgi:hypothetical protein
MHNTPRRLLLAEADPLKAKWYKIAALPIKTLI